MAVKITPTRIHFELSRGDSDMSKFRNYDTKNARQHGLALAGVAWVSERGRT